MALYHELLRRRLRCGSSSIVTAKDREIMNLYDDFLLSYDELINKLGYDDAIDLLAIYSFALNNGYLSKNKEFKKELGNYNNDLFVKGKGYGGAGIFTGFGVCRHINAGLLDTIRIKNIEAYPVCVKTGKGISSHVFTATKENNLVCFLDATRNCINEYTDKNMNIITPDGVYPVSKIATFYLNINEKNGYVEAMKLLSNNNCSLDIMEKSNRLLNKTLECFINKSIFEDFYKQNKYLYEEATDKILTLYKRQ